MADKEDDSDTLLSTVQVWWRKWPPLPMTTQFLYTALYSTACIVAMTKFWIGEVHTVTADQ